MLEYVPKFKIEQIKEAKARLECQNISYLMFYYNFTIIPISLEISRMSTNIFKFEK